MVTLNAVQVYVVATTYAWIGDGAPPMEVARVERRGRSLVLSYPGIARRA